MPRTHRDFPTPLADYRDLYGLMPDSTEPRPKRAAQPSAPSQPPSSSSSSSGFSLPRFLRKKERRSAPSPTTSHVDHDSSSRRSSIDSQMTLTAPPSAPAPAPASASSKSQPKDYEQAFGTLAMSYGFGGSSFAPVPKQSTSGKPHTR
ncbi:hypothetical protein EW145_g8532 [Phellinidium pouzarii]|uniref:Uncharacterized protein n=1 Tax=Phellinidium pouzarii TaxID=167371 RepID=A0A4S4K5A7_9AGAM|nr:hypothetical protein EW145_g8532 [Phellinidium pouzarii]